ncbi:hypothetical protein [Pseudomonas sp. yb_5]|uniref:hypothetical protein n=1 Tax=Pseudomonas sp. yb_5 TaxID=3367220 RepID=UPI00370A9030
MTPFEIDVYRHCLTIAKREPRKLTFPQFLRAIDKSDVPVDDKAAIASLINDAGFQKVLYQVGTNLWIGCDHLIRVVDTLSHRGQQEVGKNMCRLCLCEEDDARELVRVGDASWVHHLCRERYEKMRFGRRAMGGVLDGE